MRYAFSERRRRCFNGPTSFHTMINYLFRLGAAVAIYSGLHFGFSGDAGPLAYGLTGVVCTLLVTPFGPRRSPPSDGPPASGPALPYNPPAGRRHTTATLR